MASTTTDITLTDAWQDISGGNVDIFCIMIGYGEAELLFAPSAAPARTLKGVPLTQANVDGMSFGAIDTADRVWARGTGTLRVMQKAI